jgi:hypothetical protein
MGDEAALLAQITELVALGTTGRGPSGLCRPRLWADALDIVSGAARVAVVSGFYVPAADAPETDGPLGSLTLARALLRCGKETEVWTDTRCLSCFHACGEALRFPREGIVDVSAPGVSRPLPDLLIYLERLGRAQDGRYYNMRGEDISEWTPPLDAFALTGGVPVVAVGDGGNEVGMGNYREELSRLMPDYRACLCCIEADVCIPVDVSNWGGYALSALLSARVGTWLGQTAEEERAMLRALCDCGVVDGRTRACAMSVDGLPLEEHLRVRDALEHLVT